MIEETPDAILVRQVIDAHAYDLEGLTLDELELDFYPKQLGVLMEVLTKGEGGRITPEEKGRLRACDFSDGFIVAISHGDLAMKVRAGWLGDNALTRWWRVDFDDGERRDIVRELGSMGAGAADQVSVLIEALDDPEVCLAAIGSLGEIGSGAAVLKLVGLLKDEDAYIVGKAARALGRIGDERAIPALAAIIRKPEQDDFVVHLAIEALGKIDPLNEEAFAALLCAIGDSFNITREKAAEAIYSAGPGAGRYMPGLIAQLGDGDYRKQVIAARALGVIDLASPDVEPALISALKEGGVSLRAVAAFSLGWVEDASPKATAALVDALEDDHQSVRVNAVSALGDRGAVVELLEARVSHCDFGVMRAAEKALDRFGADAVPKLVTALEHDDLWVRREAAECLNRIEGAAQEGAQFLLGLLDAEDHHVRAEAAWMLGWLECATPDVVTALEESKGDRRLLVRINAAVSLNHVKELAEGEEI